mgnify:CR=1 FL=1|jgi:hypothetical protein
MDDRLNDLVLSGVVVVDGWIWRQMAKFGKLGS